jgi:hypothetical protein
VFSAPLLPLVTTHVNGAWPKTHFLSLTSDRAIAEWFADGGRSRVLTPLPPDAKSWDTAVLKFDTGLFSAVSPTQTAGIYLCSYQPRPPLRPGGDPFLWVAHVASPVIQSLNPRNLLVVDVVAALAALSPVTAGVAQALSNAQRYQEWLFLPIDPIETPAGAEFTCLIETTIVTRLDKYNW